MYGIEKVEKQDMTIKKQGGVRGGGRGERAEREGRGSWEFVDGVLRLSPHGFSPRRFSPCEDDELH